MLNNRPMIITAINRNVLADALSVDYRNHHIMQ